MKGLKKLLSLAVLAAFAAVLLTAGVFAADNQIYDPAPALAVSPTEAAASDGTVISDPEVPLAAGPTAISNTTIYEPAPPLAPNTESSVTEIDDSETPLSAAPALAIVNIVLAAVTFIVPVALSVIFLFKKDKVNFYGSDTEAARKGLFRLIGLLVGMAAIVACYLTQEFGADIVVTDNWTALMAEIAAVQLLVTFFSLKKSRKVTAE